MREPDFEKMAKRAMDQWDINRIYGAVVYELQAAYSLGLDRAAEIADEQGNVHKHVSCAIRAEREKS